jgi:dihydrofolate reductase
MRKVIAAAFVSTDGVMQAPGAPQEDLSGGFRYGGWVAPYFDGAVGQAVDQLFGPPFDLLLGRKTYEIFAAVWPFAEDGPNADIARAFNAVRKYVATRSDAPLTWQNSVALRDAATDVARLKNENGPNLVIQGSSNLIQTLLAEELIDEISLLIFPVVLGSGKRFFGDGAKPGGLKLQQSVTSASGVTINRYLPDGAVRTGDFTPETPSEAEVERRERVQQEG